MVLLLRCVLLASAPALFWLWLYYRRDRWEPEPKALVLKLFFLGALAAAPAYFLELHLPAPGGLFFEIFVRVALVEECCKLLPVYWFAYRRREFNEPMDGIVYAVAAALGFVTVENVLFAVWRGEWVILSRAFTATLAHVGLSGLVGYHLGRAKFVRRGRLRLVGAALLAVTALHGIYDLLLLWASQPEVPQWIGGVTVGVMVPGLLLLLWWAMRLADRASPFRPHAPDAR